MNCCFYSIVVVEDKYLPTKQSYNTVIVVFYCIKTTKVCGSVVIQLDFKLKIIKKKKNEFLVFQSKIQYLIGFTDHKLQKLSRLVNSLLIIMYFKLNLLSGSKKID